MIINAHFFNNKEKKRRTKKQSTRHKSPPSFLFIFLFLFYSPNDIFSFLPFSLIFPPFSFLPYFSSFFFFSTIAWSTICWQCTTRLPFARTTIPSGAGCGCIQVMNNILELSVKKKTNNDTIFTAGSRRNCHDTRKQLLRIRKCLSNT